MEYKSNTKELLARIKRIRELIAAGTFSDALVAGLNAGMGAMKRRIFDQSLDAEGATLGPYHSESYKRKRNPSYAASQSKRKKQVKAKGPDHQIIVKDLELDGTLRRSIEVITVNNTKAEIRITSEETAKIARYQEAQIFNLRQGKPGNSSGSGKVPIFQLDTDELDIVRTNTRELLKQKFNF